MLHSTARSSAKDLGGFPEMQRSQFVEIKARVGEVKCNKVDDDDFCLLTFRLADNRGFILDLELLSRCCVAGRREVTRS